MIADVHEQAMGRARAHLIGVPWTSADTFRRSMFPHSVFGASATMRMT